MENGFSKINTSVTAYSFTSFDTLEKDVKNYDYAVVYKLDKVVVEKASDLTDGLFDDELSELRAFGKDGELHVVNTGSGLVGRIRTDGSGEKTEYLDESHLIWGEPKERKDGKTFLIEDRGTQLWLPIDVPDGERAFITVRNYLSAPNATFEFTDFRMVGFFPKKVSALVDETKDGGKDNG